MALPKKPKRSPAEGKRPFEYGWEPAQETLTAYAGIPLFVRAARSFVLAGSVARHLRLKQRQRGFDEAAYVESLLVLNALGGDCLEDFDRLREDAGLAEMLGHEIPSPEAARKFLYQFHDESRIEAAQQELAVGRVSYVPSGSETLDEVRYLAIRVTRRRGGLFDDGTVAKHFAVVTNRFDFDGQRVLEWHREKAGSVEALHHVLKNEVAAGVLPCGRFGANAAWPRLAVLTHSSGWRCGRTTCGRGPSGSGFRSSARPAQSPIMRGAWCCA